MNDFIVTNVNVIVNLLSKHCAEIILRLHILLCFYSSYYSSYISTAWSAYKGVGGEEFMRVRSNRNSLYTYTYPNFRESLGVSIQMKESEEKVTMYLQ